MKLFGQFLLFITSLALITSCSSYSLLITSETSNQEKVELIKENVRVNDDVRVSSRGTKNNGSVNGYNDSLLVVAGKFDQPQFIVIQDIDSLYVWKTEYLLRVTVNNQRNSTGAFKIVEGYLMEVADSSIVIVRKKKNNGTPIRYNVQQIEKIKTQARGGTFIGGFLVGFIPWTIVGMSYMLDPGEGIGPSTDQVMLAALAAGTLTGLATGSLAKGIFYKEKFLIEGDYQQFQAIKDDLRKYIQLR
jgi:hypothetical protein